MDLREMAAVDLILDLIACMMEYRLDNEIQRANQESRASSSKTAVVFLRFWKSMPSGSE